MSKINLLKLINSLENKYNNKNMISETVQESTQPAEQLDAKPVAKSAEQPDAKSSTQTATSVKTGGTISNIKICDVLVFEESSNRKKNDGKMELITHWKIENDDAKDIPIDNENFNITFVDETQTKDVKKSKSNFFTFGKK
jgi:hypothetical protein